MDFKSNDGPFSTDQESGREKLTDSVAAGIARRLSPSLHLTPALRGYNCTNTIMDSTKRGFMNFTASSHAEDVDDDGKKPKMPTVVKKLPIRLTSF